MESLIALAAISAAIAVGAMSPGPSFVLVARTALAAGKRAGLLAALGMAIAGMLFATLAVVGIAAALTSAGWLLSALKLAGGLFLAYLGISMFRHAKAPLAPRETKKAPSRFLINGFAVQISNPKTIVVYASVFSALLPKYSESWLAYALPPAIGIIELTWYVIVALVFSNPKAEKTYLKRKVLVDRVASVVMIGLALRLLTTL